MTTHTLRPGKEGAPFGVVSRGDAVANMTTCRRDEGWMYALARSNADKGWHIVGAFEATGPGAHLEAMVEALNAGRISTDVIDCWRQT